MMGFEKCYNIGGRVYSYNLRMRKLWVLRSEGGKVVEFAPSEYERALFLRKCKEIEPIDANLAYSLVKEAT